jgi:hypothetical protein
MMRLLLGYMVGIAIAIVVGVVVVVRQREQCEWLSTSNAEGLLTCYGRPKRRLTCTNVSRRLSALGGVSRWCVP